MPWDSKLGRFTPARKPLQRQGNPALLVLWLAVRLIKQELVASGMDWDIVISTFRGLLGEFLDKRSDYHEDGTKYKYSEFPAEIDAFRNTYRAW